MPGTPGLISETRPRRPPLVVVLATRGNRRSSEGMPPRTRISCHRACPRRNRPRTRTRGTSSRPCSTPSLAAKTPRRSRAAHAAAAIGLPSPPWTLGRATALRRAASPARGQSGRRSFAPPTPPRARGAHAQARYARPEVRRPSLPHRTVFGVWPRRAHVSVAPKSARSGRGGRLGDGAAGGATATATSAPSPRPPRSLLALVSPPLLGGTRG